MVVKPRALQIACRRRCATAGAPLTIIDSSTYLYLHSKSTYKRVLLCSPSFVQPECLQAREVSIPGNRQQQQLYTQHYNTLCCRFRLHYYYCRVSAVVCSIMELYQQVETLSSSTCLDSLFVPVALSRRVHIRNLTMISEVIETNHKRRQASVG